MKFGTKFIKFDKTSHDQASFDCGENELNLFFKTKAAKHMRVGISKTMVLPTASPAADTKYPICAFYTIAPSSIKRASLPRNLAKKLPFYPVPVFLIAQMAVHVDYQGQGLGKITLVKALEYLWEINTRMAAYAIVVDCLNENVEKFYEKYGFSQLCACEEKTRMFLPMNVLDKLFS